MMTRSNGEMPAGTARRPWRWVGWAAGLAALVLGGAALALPALLDSAWLQARLSTPEGLSVRWEGSRPGWGSLRVDALVIEREDASLPLVLEVDAARLELDLPALLTRRLAIRALDASGLRRLEIDGHRLSGEGRLRLTGLDLARDEVGVERLSLALEQALVTRDGLRLAEDISLIADLVATPFDPGAHPGQAALRFLSGEIALGARADAWDLFTPYLAELGWLGLAGRGSLTGELALEGGVLAPGSRLVLDSPALAVTLDEAALLAGPGDPGDTPAWVLPDQVYRLQGAGSVAISVDEAPVERGDQLPGRLAVTLEALAMHQGDTPAPLLTAQRFRLDAPLPTDLAAVPRPPTAATLRWEAASVPDIRALARFLPEAAPLALDGGRAALDGHLAYRDGRLAGAFTLAGEGVALTLQGQPVSGDLRLDLALPTLDPGTRQLDLSGTRLRLDAHSDESAESLALDLTLEAARLASRVPLEALREYPLPPLDGELALFGRLDRLAFLDPFLSGLFEGRGVGLSGGGELTAKAQLVAGRLDGGSRLAVTSEALGVSLPHARAEGRGHLIAEWRDDNALPLRLAARLEEAEMIRHGDGARLLDDARLTLDAEGHPPEAGVTPLPRRGSLAWEGASLANVAVLAPYLPPGAPFSLSSGRASSQGRLALEEDGVSGGLRLSGDRISGRLLDETVTGEMTLDLVLREASLDGRLLDLSGSRLALSATAGNAEADQRLGSVLVARQARFTRLDEPAARQGRLVLEGMVDRLGFLDAFLPREHGLALRGRGRLAADLRLRGEQLLAESHLRVDADELSVGFLDYRAEGRGELEAHLEGEAPAARLRLSLPRFALRREAEQERTWLAGRHLSLETAVPRFSLDTEALDIAEVTTRVALPIVEVPDLALYNAYLPEAAGVELLGGRASLEAALQLEGLGARGDLVLQGFGAELRLADQRLSGDLRLEARLREGDLAGRRFDAAGSLLRLDNVTRRDADGQGEAGWWARLALEEGQLTWTEPLEVNARLGLAMRDSGLLARLFLAGARERDWLGRLLTVRDIQGEARLTMDADGIRLDEARLTGGQLALQADLAFRDERLDGRLHARLGRLAVGIALEEGERQLRFWQPRRWFEDAARDEESEPLLETTPEAFREALPSR
jgi:translocation and assembly module TamB